MQQKGIYAKDELRDADLDDSLFMDGKIVSPSEIGTIGIREHVGKPVSYDWWEVIVFLKDKPEHAVVIESGTRKDCVKYFHDLKRNMERIGVKVNILPRI